jgi:flagellar basal-body rod protein FlgG
MQSSYYQNTGAMVTQFNRLDTITNNLANVNTAGYKRDDVVIGDFKRIFDEFKEELPIQNNTKDGAKYYNATVTRVPQVVESYSSNELGAMKQTGNTLDFALEKTDLYFAVDTPNGVRLTRDGSFTLNGEGVLVNKSGYPVLASTHFENAQPLRFEQDQMISVDKNGVIYTKAVDDDAAEFAQVGAIMITGYENQKKLEKEGKNLYRFEDEGALRISQNSNAISQGVLEMSNVNAVIEMTSLIDAQRMVEMYQKVMRTHMDDLNQEAITKLSTLKA